MKALGTATILVHHSRKSTAKGGSNFRGSSKIAATFESIIELQPRTDISESETGFGLRWEKFRRSPKDKGKALRVRLLSGETSTEQAGVDTCRWEHEEDEDTRLIELVRAVQSCAFPSQNAIADHLKITKGTISKWKRDAFRKGLITRDDWDDCLAEARSSAARSEDL